MKKFFAMIFVLVAALTLGACTKTEFKVDGEFTAFEQTIHNDAPQITSVTVTIEKGKITKFYIDSTQGVAVKDGEEFTAVKWNEKSKKELGYFYGMHFPQAGLGPITEANLEAYKTWLTENEKLEWFEQANLIEAKWLADGVDSVTTDKGVVDNVAGVTVKDGGYIALAKKAVENAKAGKVVVYELGDTQGKPDIYWAEGTYEGGKLKTLVIDTLQSSFAADQAFTWNEKSKQELGYFYGMHFPEAGLGPITEANLEAYKTWLTENEKLEWFEQVKIITDDVLANGYKNAAAVDALAGVTVTTSHYSALIDALLKAVK